MGERYSLSVSGDKGYVGRQIHEDMASRDICLAALKRNNSKNQCSKPFRQMIFKSCRRIETVFSQLSEQLNAERVLVRTLRGLWVVSLKDLGRKLASEKESINEYTDYSFMKFLALGKTDGLSCQSFNSCSQCQMISFDLLCISFPRNQFIR